MKLSDGLFRDRSALSRRNSPYRVQELIVDNAAWQIVMDPCNLTSLAAESLW